MRFSRQEYLSGLPLPPPGVGDGQGGLACCDSWGHKESDTTERLNWAELKRLHMQNNQNNLEKGEEH